MVPPPPDRFLHHSLATKRHKIGKPQKAQKAQEKSCSFVLFVPFVA